MRTTLEIFQGDTGTATEVISGLASLEGFDAELYVVDKDGTAVDTVAGTIGTEVGYELYVYYDFTATADYPVGVHRYETKLYDGTDVYTPSYGRFLVRESLENEPGGT